MVSDPREIEREKYRHVYKALPRYAMGGARMLDAIDDLHYAAVNGARTLLDIGCGRGEMLAHADRMGYHRVRGADAVPELCEEDNVDCVMIHELFMYSNDSFDLVTSFDVIEHVLPGDDLLLLQHMSRIAKTHMAITANNKPSVDPTTGNDLHINKREYDVWDAMIRKEWEPDWHVERLGGKRYVSETWRAHR